MMISRTQIDQVLKIYQATKASKPVSRDESVVQNARQDDVRLSFSRQDIEKVRQLAEAQPDIRWDRIEPLIRALEAGEYSVDPKSVADKMLGRLLVDEIE